MSDTAVIFNILAKDNASGTLDKVGKAAVSMFTAFAAGKVLDFAKGAIDSASNLSESISKAKVVFGQGDVAVEKFASTAATALGISRQEALESTATFGNFFEAMGIGQTKAEGMSTSMVKMASDLASFNNADPAQVLEDLRSGLAGQVEPLRKYGVDLSDATLQQEAMRLGLIKHTQVLTAGQKAQAAYGLIMKQTGTAQGDFGRTSGGLANQQRIMSAEFENAKEKIGTGLLPAVVKLTHGLVELLGFVQKNSGWLTPLAIGLGVLAAGIWLVTAAQTAWDIAMMMNPIGLVIIAVIALVAVIIYLWTHSAAFREFFIGLWNDIWGFLKGVGHWFAHDFVDFFKGAWKWIKDTAGDAADWIHNKWSGFINFFTSMPGKIKGIASGMWDGIWNAFKNTINLLIRGWNTLRFGVPRIDTHIPGVGVVGGFSFGVPQIPYLAAGGTVASGGLAVVGERGPELVSLPTGATVHPNGSPAGGSGVLVVKFAGNTDSAFATAFMRLVREKTIQIEAA